MGFVLKGHEKKMIKFNQNNTAASLLTRPRFAFASTSLIVETSVSESSISSPPGVSGSKKEING